MYYYFYGIDEKNWGFDRLMLLVDLESKFKFLILRFKCLSILNCFF